MVWSDDIIDIELILITETDRAYLVKLDEDGDKTWLPKSQCAIGEVRGMSRGAPIHLFRVKEWILIEKGLA